MKQAPMREIGLLTIVLVVMYVLAGCGNTDATQASSQPLLTTTNEVDIEQAVLRITGMS